MRKNSITDIYWKTSKDTKGTWKVFNSIIQRNRNFTPFPDPFFIENKTYKSKQEIASGFIELFVNIGPLYKESMKHNILS